MATRKGHSNFMAVQGEPTNPEWQLDLITSNSMKHGGGDLCSLSPLQLVPLPGKTVMWSKWVELLRWLAFSLTELFLSLYPLHGLQNQKKLCGHGWWWTTLLCLMPSTAAPKHGPPSCVSTDAQTGTSLFQPDWRRKKPRLVLTPKQS